MDKTLMKLKNCLDDTILKYGKLSTDDKKRLYNASINHGRYKKRDYFPKIASVILVLTFSIVFGNFIIQNLKSDITDTNNVETTQLLTPNSQMMSELKIGVVGKSPEVEETNVQFEEIDLNEITKMDLRVKYDGIIIMKDFLSEAAQPQYAEIYKTSGVPFFFIQSEKSYLPFTEEEIEYDGFPDSNTQDYATGYYQNGDNTEFWGFGLYNDKQTDKNVKDVYTRIFKTISNIEDK
ncbi:hypothetical protein [Ferdinandcohnia sp. SAFN-114]|uniref:hypothetical protein n=1 Tax=Ferdinandcohnia sp. SAFN-114 TaxID=3387275 RepID=UPI003F7F21E8